MSDCLFCKMVNKEIQPDIVYENDLVLAFKDINPQAPIHILLIPKKHIATINNLEESDKDILSAIFSAIQTITKQFNIDKTGYRVVINTNDDSGQEVFHLHCHILGGRKLTWPPG